MKGTVTIGIDEHDKYRDIQERYTKLIQDVRDKSKNAYFIYDSRDGSTIEVCTSDQKFIDVVEVAKLEVINEYKGLIDRKTEDIKERDTQIEDRDVTMVALKNYINNLKSIINIYKIAASSLLLCSLYLLYKLL